MVGADDDLLDDVLRLLATAGCTPEVAQGGAPLRRAHRTASLVVLCADALASAAVRGLPRRPGVLVVADRDLPADDWAAAVEAGAERVLALPRDEHWFVERVVTALRVPVARGWLAAVAGSCGGAGASTLAAALALTAAPATDGVLDADADGWGGGAEAAVALPRIRPRHRDNASRGDLGAAGGGRQRPRQGAGLRAHRLARPPN